MSDRCPSFRRFSESLAGQIDGWIESKPYGEKSLLFAEWVTGAGATTRADQLCGSLGLTAASGDVARKRAYLAMLAAVVLTDHSAGIPMKIIERRWELSPVDGVEESWRDTLIWLLAGHAAILEIRNFYHHLREFCSATQEQVRSTKQALIRMRRQTYDLMEELKYCSLWAH
jgi:hypothetical protein